jgi:hypothetical protein
VPSISSGDALIVTAGAAAGAAVAARWMQHRVLRRQARNPVRGVGPDRVEELHSAFRDPTAYAGRPQEALRRYRSQLCPLQFESATPTPPAPARPKPAGN